MKTVHFILFFLSIFIIACHSDQPSSTLPETTLNKDPEQETTNTENDFPEFQKILSQQKVIGTILIYNSKTGMYYSNNFKRAETGYLPASTFKIPNSMIALEADVIKDPTTMLKWDGQPRGQKMWEKDMNFREAFQRSCFPCYREITREVGLTKTQHYVDLLNFGSMVLDSASLDIFWVRGESKITAFEQIDFLERFFNKKLPISDRTYEIMKQLMLMKTDDPYILSGKTGWAIIDDINLGWFVGFAETDNNVYYMATNIEPSPEFDMKDFYKTRIDVSKQALELIIGKRE